MVAGDLHHILSATVSAVAAKVSEDLQVTRVQRWEYFRRQHFVNGIWNSNTPFPSPYTLVAGLRSVSCSSVDAEGAKKRQ